jgi:hypothetical protein
VRKWMIRLEGSETDLGLVAEALSRLESHKIEREGDLFYLSSSTTTDFESDDAIREHARRMTAIIRGLARLYAPAARDWKCTDYLVKIDESGQRTATTTVMTEVKVAWRIEGEECQTKYAAAVRSAAAELAGLEWAALLLDRDLTWPELYKLVELIESDMGSIPESWASKRELEAFTASANHPAISGLEARHGVLPGAAPRASHRMDARTAQALVLKIAKLWLDQRAR